MRATGKPFTIDKKQVYEAYKAVKSKGGAAGEDGQTIEQFEADLKNNLYKIWNRMSSGTGDRTLDKSALAFSHTGAASPCTPTWSDGAAGLAHDAGFRASLPRW
jgi:hypothetical protein